MPFLQYTPDRAWAETAVERIRGRLANSPYIALDPDAVGYAQFPIDFAPTPDSPLRSCLSAAR